jgi:hypothetical protein
MTWAEYIHVSARESLAAPVYDQSDLERLSIAAALAFS